MPVAELLGVTKRYGDVQALRGVDLTIARGELLALLGPNGAGKTTAVRILLGLAEPTSGEATLFGHHPASQQAKVRRGALSGRIFAASYGAGAAFCSPPITWKRPTHWRTESR